MNLRTHHKVLTKMQYHAFIVCAQTRSFPHSNSKGGKLWQQCVWLWSAALKLCVGAQTVYVQLISC